MRRVVMVGSVGLMVLALALWIRGWFADDFIILRRVMVVNVRHGLVVTPKGHWRSWIDVEVFSQFPPRNTLSTHIPKVLRITPAFPTLSLELPHWFLFVVGSAYPTIVWLGRRMRKKSIGFPVEAGTKEK